MYLYVCKADRHIFRRYDMDGFPFALSVYRVDALDSFYQSGCSADGIGVLACGSGKTAGREFILTVIKINKIP